MPLSFLAPAFLLGLLSLTVPLLIHLFRRERSSRVEFPSLMFLQRIPYRSIRRQRIRHWLLLLLRCAVLVLLVLAFARPLFEGAGVGASALEGGREVVILLDQSYSMGFGDRWQRGLRAARQGVDTLGPQDQATIVLFSDRAVATDRPSADRASLQAILDRARLSSNGTHYSSALKLARKLLLESDLPRREVFLVSDFQKVGWSGEDRVQLPLGTELHTEDLSDPEASNLAVVSMLLERQNTSGRERVTVSGRVANRGDVAFEDVGIALELGGRSQQVKRVRVEPNDATRVTFDPVTLPQGITQGTVRAVAGSDSLETDNAFHFVLSPTSEFGVLVLVGPGAAGRASSLYLRRALELGERPSFQVEVKPASRFQAADLDDKRIVILNDAPMANATPVRRFVEEGGGLLVAMGRSILRSQNRAAEVLSLPQASLEDRRSDWGGRIAYLNYSHPVLEVFGAPRSGDFFSAKFFHYFDLHVEESMSVVARFDDAKPALVEYPLGEGKAMVWPTTLDTFWNDLAVQPVYLPLVRRMVRYLGGYTVPKQWYTVGQVADLSVQTGSLGRADPGPQETRETPPSGQAEADDESWLVMAPSGAKTTTTFEAAPLFQLEEQGFYELRPMEPGGGDAEDDQTIVLAANLDFSESDLTPLDREELASSVTTPDAGETRVGERVETAVDKERRQRFWWYLLIAAGLLLPAETAFANRLSRRRAEDRRS